LDNILLPPPKLKGKISLEEAISRRRSIREFSSKEISIEELSQILWAAQGITGEEWGYKLRSVPSAGALYPIELYAALPRGIYHYIPERHELVKIAGQDVRYELSRAALSQEFIAQAPLDLVIAAVFERTKAKYGERGARYVYVEAGHVSQNVYLQCESLGLATVAVGAFYDEQVQRILKMPENHRPIYIMPVGYKR
jgi:SagB-type dehydrogenase family enzyme